MLRRRVLKRVGILIGILLGLIILVLLTFPYWLGYALRPAAARFGVSFANYEQAKDGRFVLTDLVRTNRAFDLRISRVEGFRPEVWYRRIGQTNQPASFLEVNGWHIVVHEKAASAAGRTNQQRSVYGEWKSAEHYIEQARKWAPKVTLLNGIATYQGRDYTFPIITWEGGKLDASGVWPISAVPFELKGKLTGETSYQLSYAMTPLDLRLVLRLAETNDLLNVKTTAFYKENRADINANFGHEGFLPLTATLKAPDLKVPAELLKLKNYEDLTGSLSGEWKTNNYTLSLKAHAEPFAAMSGKLPPADINVALSGDTNRVHIEKAFSTAPGLQLSISQPVDVSYRGRLLSERAEVRIDADLEKMPWLKMNGSLKGTIILEKGSKFPVATLHAEGANLSVKKFSARSAELEAKLDWPKLEEFNARFQLQTNAVLSLRGSADLKERRLGETLVEAEGAVATNALPAGIHYSSLEISAKVSGPLTNLSHEGSCELRDFETPQTQPLHLDLLWKAEQTTFERLALRARAGPATLLVAGSGYAEEGKTNFVLRELRLSKGDDPYLDLAHGANIAITSNTNAGTLLEIEPIELNGTNKQLVVSGKLSWPALGDVKLNTRNINPELFQFFVKRTLSGIDLPELALAAQWSNGPFYGKLAGNFSVEQPQFKRLSAEVNLDLEENGLTLTRLGVSDPNGPIFDARGFLPLSIRPLDTERVHLSSRDQIDLELHTTRNAALWDTVAKLTKLRVTNAAVHLTVHGTTRRPTGELQIRADSVNYLGLRTNRELPRIGPLEGKIVLNEQILHIPELSVRLAEQPVKISGRMPLGDNFWTQRREEILKYTLDHADLRIEAPDVKVAPFAHYFSKYITPQGQLALEAEVKPGQNLDGRFTLRGLETRPIAQVGVVQGIQARVSFQGKEVKIDDFSGIIGGERLAIAGYLNFTPERLAKGYPDVDLRITGTNVPLARNPDVILRSDLNLHVRNGTNQTPIITGDATLRDSFLLRDISTLVPGRVASPKRRPPFFSIEQDPIDDWRLDVRVVGDNFMRVRSPFFQGVVSANFRVNGTLLEPMALGDASISSGTIIFPFATLETRQALVSMTSDDPYLPHVFAIATGRAFGFDIRMQAEGPANQPVLQFSSVPALTSEQIVLMITTGQIPRTDFGFSNQDRASKLAMFLGKGLWAKLHPGQPGEERLTIRSGQDITEQGRQTYEVDYKLNDRWSLVGEYDRFGALNANVKWKLFSK